MALAMAVGWSLAPAAWSQTAPDSAAVSAVDHAGIVSSWDEKSFARGQKLYQAICVTCHGNLEQAGTLPTSRPFWKEPFKNGNDPYSLYRTITEGFGQMPAWPWLTPELRYDVVQYIREAFVKPHNAAAYFPITPAYLERLPKGPARQAAKSSRMLEFEKGPKYLRMDFGPALFWTIEVEPGNIAYKGIAVRLDEGPGGVSMGRAWMLYDHDTMRVAAVWTGGGFIDWKGIAFDGSHGTHARIVGERIFTNPAGPGWANPAAGGFADPRFLGRDGRPYGPLPRDWARFKGVYLHEHRVAVWYTVGETEILELPALEASGSSPIFSRTLNLGISSEALVLRVAPATVSVAVTGDSDETLVQEDGFHLLRMPASSRPRKLKLLLGRAPRGGEVSPVEAFALVAEPAADLGPLTQGGPPRWTRTVTTSGKPGAEDGPFAVDLLSVPNINPWNSWMRLGAFDFLEDGRRAAVCTWNGDVWLVDGVEGTLEELRWRRIVSGLFQPLGVRTVDGQIYVACRDQIARLRDLNGDGETDFIENLNNDHQVTEHFHEFAMGLQTDREGNFYYAKSARHALPPLVPHHGTLLKVSADGARTEIVATGFRAANGVCVNDDGTFYVTDQEGHWHPKNRINLVKPGGFYGNMWSYHHPSSSADDAMEQPLVWITNEMDRSPGELVRVPAGAWGQLGGALLNLSYGTGRIFLVLPEQVNGQVQGGVVALPIPDFPTGVMRGRFHPGNGHLYACGLFAWAGNQTEDGGFYRIRRTNRAACIPIELGATAKGVKISFSDPLDPSSAHEPANYAVKTWSLRRSEKYGSDHYDERNLRVARARLSADRRSVFLELPEIRPTSCMEIKYHLGGANGTPVNQRIHNTIHRLGDTVAIRPFDE